MIKWRRDSILDIYNLALGGVLLISPWLLASTHGPMGKEDLAGGVIIVALALGGLLAFTEWEEWGLLVVGLWLVVSPWMFGFQSHAAMKLTVAIGILVAYLAALELWLLHYYVSPKEPNRTPKRQR